MAKNFFLYLQVPEKCTDEEDTLFRFYIETVLSTWKRKHNNDKSNDEWHSVLAICREKSRTLLAELIAFVLFPAQIKGQVNANCKEDEGHKTADQVKDSIKTSLPWVLKRRLITVRYLTKEIFQNRSHIVNLLEVDLDYQYAMKIALHELALLPNIVQKYSIGEYDGELERMIRFLRSIQIDSPLANLTKDEISSLASDEVLLVHSYYQNKCQFCNQLLAKAGMICDKENTLIKFTSDKAMTLTCEIAEYQNIPRRAFIQWPHFVREFCHPQAVFFDPNSWPRKAQTQARPLPISDEVLKKDKRGVVENTNSLISPLENLLQDFKNQKTLDHVEAISQVRLSISATLLRTAFECSGEIVVSDSKLYFLGEHAKSTQKGFIHAPVTYSWSFEQVREIHSRFCQLKDTALELFTTTGDAFLVVFATTQQRNVLLEQFNSMGLGQLIVDHKAQLQTATQMWRRDVITNFEYLMVLNKLAGRSFNDLMQYPVFPFVLSDYASAIIDLTCTASYRDLSRPMAIQDAKMEPTYIHNYNYSAEEFKRHHGGTGFSSPVRFGAYHYGSHYSNTGIVAHYLVRVSPYTNVALEYQDNNFDIPDRLFNSMETTWRLSSSESTTDFKELIPEFFFFPEMFENLEGLDLGIRQNGRPVDDVILPSWCPSNNARLFCLIHRQALESSVVTANLHFWIDLIFGFKQSGEQAVKAVNLFHPATYRGRDLEGESGSDELSISAIRTMVRTYGQMPLNLFASPHLPHLNASRSSSLSSSHHSRNSPSNGRPGSAQGRSTPTIPSLLRSVHGLRWGDFVGSPEIEDKYYSTPSTVFSLDKTESLYKDGLEICYGIPNSAKLIVDYKSDRKDALRRNFELTVSAMLSWCFSDNVLRIRSLDVPNSSWINLIDMQSLELAKVSFSPSNDLLYVGFKCGLIRVYSLVFSPTLRKWSISLRSELLAHKCTITSLEVSDEFHILLSTSIDAKICVWDSNRLEFVCVLLPPATSNNAEETVTLSCISRTNSDICVVLQSASAVEWPSIALQSGAIRLLEMWTMTVIRTISFPNYHDPIISIHFTNESRRLYAAFAGGTVVCWQVPSMASSSAKYRPVFKMLTPNILLPIGCFLDEPVITIWTNNSADGNGSSVGTLGAVDTEHCQSNWIYVPQDSNKYYPYSFHVSSVELTLNGTKQQLGLNKTMVVDQYVDSMYLPASLKPWFVNATNAIYDSNSGYYKVDCDVSKAAKLVFNIGGKGNTTSSANKQLVISAADYVAYSESSDICYLATYFSKHLSVLEMNIQFSNNHCIAYNIKDNTIGIADSKTPITDVKQLNK
uniref:Uncharacterized protein n=1 Tax=Ditylenchus dipsaci TaxID=166011 RepID=A0A915DNE7_9BILA